MLYRFTNGCFGCICSSNYHSAIATVSFILFLILQEGDDADPRYVCNVVENCALIISVGNKPWQHHQHKSSFPWPSIKNTAKVAVNLFLMGFEKLELVFLLFLGFSELVATGAADIFVYI